MEIGPLSNRRPELIKTENQADPQPGTETGRGPGDVIEISYNGRLKLAELADAALKSEPPVSNTRGITEYSSTRRPDQAKTEDLSDDRDVRIRRIRERIDSGFYDRSDVKRTIADRLIDDMDI